MLASSRELVELVAMPLSSVGGKLTNDVAVDKLSRAADDIQTATDQIPRAADLDDKIQQAYGLLAALDELARLLSDGKFIGYVRTILPIEARGHHRVAC